ncbi:MAG: STAS domain-containing protein [Planctomycetota bacterium]
MASKLDIRTEDHGPVCVISLTGMLDGHTAPALERELHLLHEQGCRRMVMDLAGLTYIASAGVGIMINYFQQVSQDGGNLRIARPSPTVKEIFSLLGLETLLSIHTDLDEAIDGASA